MNDSEQRRRTNALFERRFKEQSKESKMKEQSFL
jgi:hypothetical protein